MAYTSLVTVFSFLIVLAVAAPSPNAIHQRDFGPMCGAGVPDPSKCTDPQYPECLVIVANTNPIQNIYACTSPDS
jgi:hypothetical protein